ncbi:MAG: hypothetical protein IPJ74_00685 [Saprospiraceae bacterium]|nr:hypothetical protein [Saprospiraceae bacterium]
MGNYYVHAQGSAPETAFNKEPIFKRLDPIINFSWGNESPAPGLIPIDYFTVRWLGKIMPKINGLHTFHVFFG